MITTDREVAALVPPDGKERIALAVKSRAGNGLSIEARAGRKTKSWIYRFYFQGKQTKMTIGNYPALALAQARLAHAKAVELVKQGIDPRKVARETKAQNEQMPTFSEVYSDWLLLRTNSKPISQRTLTDYEGTYRRHLEKGLGAVRVCDLSRAFLYTHLNRVRQVSAEGVRKGLIILNMTLDHAVHQGYLEHNPARLLKPSMFGASMSPPRERWLPKEELRLVWEALNAATTGAGAVVDGGRGIASSVILSIPVANCLRLIMLTAVRRSEAVSMRWEQINGDRWTIPQTKNGRSHVVTLSPLALDLLDQQREFSQSPWVFESTSKIGSPITGDAITRALERVRLKYLGEVEAFSPHDLRRSVATGCAEYLDAPERLIELLLNHVPKDRLVRTYQVGQQAEKLRALFLRWGAFLADEVANSSGGKAAQNVIAINFG